MPGTEEIEQEHEQRVTDNRARLWEALARAESDLDQALTAHRALSVGDAWDVEYEGSDTELGRHLAEVRRLLIITRALLPTGSDATTDVDPAVKNVLRALKNGSYLT
jgi:hypothetical protein